MSDFTQYLNTDGSAVKTSARYDSTAAAWVHDMKNVGAVRPTALLTTTPLAGAGTYTQAWQDAQAVGVYYISGSVYADQAGTLYVDLADDQAHPILAWASQAVAAGTPIQLPYPVGVRTQYFRFRFVNGATPQTAFELYQTLLPGLSPRDVNVTGSSALLAGTGTAPLSGANAAAIAANACNAVVVQNDPDSTVDLMVGNALTVVPLQLVPGQSVTIPVNNTSLVFVRSNHAATNATYNWLAV